jgi:probable F420-dependent oxidoreductase
MRITGTGVWSFHLRYGDAGSIAEAARTLDGLGYSALWVPDVGGPLFEALDLLVDSAASAIAASGVLNIYQQTAEATTAWWGALTEERKQRVLLGIGVSHASFIGDRWKPPLAMVNEFLDALDTAGVPAEQRCIAALGPKMLAVARDRSAGAHSYLVTPDHTAEARAVLGNGGLFVEQGVILETDPNKARATARSALSHYFGLPNYANNWKRLGFTDDDIASQSDLLIDALVAWGDRDAIDERVQAHVDAGANHVCIQVLTDIGEPMPMDAYRALAPATTHQ